MSQETSPSQSMETPHPDSSGGGDGRGGAGGDVGDSGGGGGGGGGGDSGGGDGGDGSRGSFEEDADLALVASFRKSSYSGDGAGQTQGNAESSPLGETQMNE